MGLSKRFGDKIAVNSLSMTVQRGEVFGFLGPNGAGKTTVVKLLLGLARPTGGEALVLGAPLGNREARRRIGYLPELFRYQPLLSAREVLRLHCRLLALPKAGWDEATRSALETVDLLERGNDRVGTFSKGMQQRLGLGVALLGNPALVLLDEPTSALDPVGRHDVREIIRGLRERGSTVFLNTHLLEEAEHVCDRVAVIDKGRAIATGSLHELLGRQSAVRLKVGGLGESWWSSLGRFGRWHRQDEWTVVEGIDPTRSPNSSVSWFLAAGRSRRWFPSTRLWKPASSSYWERDERDLDHRRAHDQRGGAPASLGRLRCGDRGHRRTERLGLRALE